MKRANLVYVNTREGYIECNFFFLKKLKYSTSLKFEFGMIFFFFFFFLKEEYCMSLNIVLTLKYYDKTIRIMLKIQTFLQKKFYKLLM